MLVRKQLLDLQLEDLNIKKYDDDFSREHYDLMIKAYENGEFSHDVREIIELMPSDFYSYKEVFDNIASNNTMVRKDH